MERAPHFPNAARPGECESAAELEGESPKPLQLANLSDTLPDSAWPSDAGAPLAQLAEQLTLNQLPTAENNGFDANSAESVAPHAAVGAANRPIDANLQTIVDAWPDLPQDARERILQTVIDAGRSKGK